MTPALARAALKRDLAEALRRLGAPTDHPDRVAGADEADLSVAEHVRDMATFTRARLEETVRLCRAALQRLEDGTYGKCERCRERIPDARLKALPAALRCVGCEARHEATAEPDGTPERVQLARSRRLPEDEA